jgi:primase-polymerase (primpol)-like protein
LVILSKTHAGGNSTPNTKEHIESSRRKPKALPVRPDGIPEEMTAVPHWVAWKYWWAPERAKWTKIPISPHTDRLAKSNDPETWSSFECTYLHCYRESDADGLGYVFASDDPFCGIDLDDAIDPATGELYPWAAKVVADLHSFAELSPSGTGVKIFVKGLCPGPRHKAPHPDAPNGGVVEIYDDVKFYAMTGHRLKGSPATVNERQEALNTLYRHVFPACVRCVQSRPDPADGHKSPGAATTSRLRACVHPLSDREIIARAGASRNGAKFHCLWAGDISGYPSHSEADLALCGILAFWCGPDTGRIDRIFRRSGLMRSKWDEQHGAFTFGEMTVARALDGRTEFYKPRRACFGFGRPRPRGFSMSMKVKVAL